jgi:hypothetical protein
MGAVFINETKFDVKNYFNIWQYGQFTITTWLTYNRKELFNINKDLYIFYLSMYLCMSLYIYINTDSIYYDIYRYDIYIYIYIIYVSC